MLIRPLAVGDHEAWLKMRAALWPECPDEQSRREMQTIEADLERQAVFVAESQGRLIGFVEVSIHPHAIGCETNPVGYVEGWFVMESHRRSGVGRALLRACETWAVTKGCREIASDCLLDNDVSRMAHAAAGFRETGRLIHFARKICNSVGNLVECGK